MRKLLILLITAGVLTACGNQSVSKQSTEDSDKPIEDSNENSQKDEHQQENKDKNQIDENENDENQAKDSVENNDSSENEAEIEPEYEVTDIYSIAPIDDANPQVALITIDDAPDQYALEMAKTLKKLDAPAIFFVNGHLITSPEKEKMVKEIYDMGFEIGNHTYSHADLTTLNPEEQKKEILSVNDKVEEITRERPKFFRAPFGKNTDISRDIAKDEKMLLFNWTYGYDWNEEYMSKDAITDIMVNTELLGNGANLLMHDREWTNAGLEGIVKGLRDKGYETLDPDLIKTPRNDE